MRIKRITVAVVVTFSVWLAPLVGCTTSTQRTREAANAITVSAEDLNDAYEASEPDADKAYQGKILMVIGTVGATDVAARNPAVTLIDARRKELVQCFGFAANQKDAVSRLGPGQKVSVKGKCMGKVVMAIPVLEDCILQ